MQIARSELPRDVLEQLYVQQHATFVEIAEQTGLDRKHIARLADEYGLPRHGTRPRRADGAPGPAELLDHDWLHAQYADRHRSFKDIGQELGVTPGTVARWARRHHIPRQSNRHLSRPALGIEHIPAVLQPALGNNYQLRRLRTFLQTAGYRSISDACAALGLPSHSVTTHLALLEEDMGGLLLVRALRKRPMEPTELGHKVLNAARPLSDQLGVPTTAEPAKPIRHPHHRRPRTTAAAAARLAHLPALLRPAAEPTADAADYAGSWKPSSTPTSRP